MNSSARVLTAAVEGAVDEILIRRLCRFVGATLGQVHGRRGKAYIISKLSGYNYSAQFRHWVVLLDLDEDGPCAPDVLPRWLASPSRLMRLRIAVREVESWLLADPERLAIFLSVSPALIPSDPDSLGDPKRRMVELAKRSRRRAVREDMVPIQGSGQPVGPAYTSRMIEFIRNSESGWRPDVAAQNSDSLRRCISAISNLIE